MERRYKDKGTGMADKENNSADKEEGSKILQEALVEMEKTFGLGLAKKSRIVSRPFTLNEIVKDDK